MNQRSLFDVPDTPPAQRHSDTSIAAAERIAPKAQTLRRLVYDYIVASGQFGATDKEIQKSLQMGGSTQRPRRIELMDGKNGRPVLIKSSGRKRDGSTVWIDIKLSKFKE